MTRRKQRQLVRNAKVYAVCGAMLYLALGVGGLTGGTDGIKGDEVETQHVSIETLQEVGQTEADVIWNTVEPEPTQVPGTLEYPFNTMSFDWGGDQTEGFVYHEISEECKKSGGYFPEEMQIYTYIICQQDDFDYEIVFALIERESHCVWDAVGDDGVSFGYMQIYEKWHKEDMERLLCSDLLNPYQNVKVGVDYLAQLAEDYDAIEDVLAAYNYGPKGAREHLWSQGVHWYKYNEGIVARANELKEEKMEVIGSEED